MAITTSVIQSNALQVDGRSRVFERHTDHLGEHYLISYIAESGDVVANNLPTNAALLEEQLAAEEIAANLAEAMGDEI